MIPLPLLTALALFSATAPFATDMHLPVLPDIASEFGVSASLVQLTLSGFFVGMGVGQLIIGPVSDVVGRKRLLVAGAVLALAAAVLAAVAPGIWVLIAARVLQGFGGGACVVLSRAVIPDLAHGDEAARAFSLLMAIQGIAPAVAPVLGGLLAEPVGWRGIYWVLVALHVVQLIVAITVIPETAPGRRVAGVRAFFGELGGNYMTVLRHRVFWGYLVAMALAFGAMFSYISASSFVMQEQMGLSAMGFSLVFGMNSLGLLASSMVNARIVGRVGVKTMLRVGIAISLAATFSLLIAVHADAPHWLTLAFLFCCVFPTPLIMGNSTALGTGLLRERAGSASALLGFSQSVVAACISPLMGVGDDPARAMSYGLVGCALIAACGAFFATSRQPAA